jgi:hypothetical protein
MMSARHPADATAERLLRFCYQWMDRLEPEEVRALSDARDVLIGVAFEDRMNEAPALTTADELTLFDVERGAA